MLVEEAGHWLRGGLHRLDDSRHKVDILQQGRLRMSGTSGRSAPGDQQPPEEHKTENAQLKGRNKEEDHCKKQLG